MGPRAGLDRCGIISPSPGFDSRTVQPVASRYTGYAIWPTITVEMAANCHVYAVQRSTNDHKMLYCVKRVIYKMSHVAAHKV